MSRRSSDGWKCAYHSGYFLLAHCGRGGRPLDLYSAASVLQFPATHGSRGLLPSKVRRFRRDPEDLAVSCWSCSCCHLGQAVRVFFLVFRAACVILNPRAVAVFSVLSGCPVASSALLFSAGSRSREEVTLQLFFRISQSLPEWHFAHIRAEGGWCPLRRVGLAGIGADSKDSSAVST